MTAPDHLPPWAVEAWRRAETVRGKTLWQKNGGLYFCHTVDGDDCVPPCWRSAAPGRRLDPVAFGLYLPSSVPVIGNLLGTFHSQVQAQQQAQLARAYLRAAAEGGNAVTDRDPLAVAYEYVPRYQTLDAASEEAFHQWIAWGTRVSTYQEWLDEPVVRLAEAGQHP